MCVLQRVHSKDGNLLSKAPSGMQSGGEEEQDEEAHTPLPPPMEIIKDPSAQDDKVGVGTSLYLLMFTDDERLTRLNQPIWLWFVLFVFLLVYISTVRPFFIHFPLAGLFL